MEQYNVRLGVVALESVDSGVFSVIHGRSFVDTYFELVDNYISCPVWTQGPAFIITLTSYRSALTIL